MEDYGEERIGRYASEKEVVNREAKGGPTSILFTFLHLSIYFILYRELSELKTNHPILPAPQRNSSLLAQLNPRAQY